MKASDLIKHLSQLIAKHGDLEVERLNEHWGYDAIHKVEVLNDYPKKDSRTILIS